MAIERGIYGSLLRGIDSERSGFQYYSYTPGYRGSLEENQKLGNTLIASYRPPNTYEYNERYKATERTDADRAVASQDAEAEHPQSFSYRAVTLGNEPKAVFCYAKDIGMDWTGSRPLTPYHYSVVCTRSDLKKPPVFYCSSPSVCCNIYWPDFFDPQITETRPSTLSYLSALEEDDSKLLVPHEAAFPEITQEDIRSFLLHENRLPVFCRMLKAVMCCKDGNDGRKVVIADRKEYTLYWIAAISSVFPLDAVLDLSFNTYGYQIDDYDINGVFVPELQGIRMEPGRSATQYDPQKAGREHWVFDFSLNSFAPDLPMAQSAFMQMVQRAVFNDTVELEDYKQFITSRTAYCGMGSSYETGYAFYAALHRNSAPAGLLDEATAFAAQFAEVGDKERLLKLIYTQWLQKPDDLDMIRVFRQFYQICESQGIPCAETALNQCIANWYQIFADKNKTDLNDFAAMGSGLENLMGYDEAQLAVHFVEYAGLQGISRISGDFATPWKQMYLQKAIAFYVSSGKGSLQNETESRILYQTARSLASPSPSFPSVLEKTINGMFEVIKSLEPRMRYLFILNRAMRDADLRDAAAVVSRKLSELYIDADAGTRGQILNAINRDGETDVFLTEILAAVGGNTAPEDLANEYQMILRVCGNRYALEIENRVMCVLSGLLNPSTGTLDRMIEFLEGCEQQSGATLSDSDYQLQWNRYYDAFCAENPDFMPSNDSLSALYCVMERFREYVSPEQTNMIFAYKTIWDLQWKLRRREAGVFSDTETVSGVDLSKLPPASQTAYLRAGGELCARYWLTGRGIVPEGIYQLYTLPETINPQRADNFVIRSAFDYLVREKRNEKRNWVLVRMLEYLMEQKQNSLLETLISTLPDCDIREKDLLHQLDKETRPLNSSHGGSALNIHELSELRQMIQDAYDAAGSAGGRLGDLKSAVKGLFWR